MKRVLVAISILAGLIAAIVASLPFLFSTETVKTAIADHLQDVTGRKVTFRGDPKVYFQPFLVISIEDLTLSDPGAVEVDQPLLRIAGLDARMEILPALTGRIQFDEYQLKSPRLNLKTYSDGTSNWQFEQGKIEAAISDTKQAIADEDKPTSATGARLGLFTITDGAAQFEDMISGKRIEVTNMNGTISWPDTGSRFGIDGQAIWRGENVSVRSNVVEPLKLIAGGESSLDLEIKSTPFNLNFDGSANRISDLFLRGTVNFSTPSTRRLSEMLETKLGDFGSLSMAGEMEATSKNIRLTEAQIDISGNNASGAVSLSYGETGNSVIDGTLAFDSLDFSTLLAERVETGSEPAIAGQTRGNRVDLRVSANTIDVGFMRLAEVAAIVTADNEQWTVDIGDASTFGGQLIAKFGERIENGNLEGFLDASGTGLNATELSALFTSHKIRFSGESKVLARLRGNDMRDILNRRGLAGSLEIRLTNGAIAGLDLPLLLSGNIKETNSTSAVSGLGSETAFDSASVNLFITDNIATIGKSAINSGDRLYRFFGRIDLNQGNLSLRAQEVDQDGPQPERLFLGGTLSAPLVSIKRLQKSRNDISTEHNVAGIGN